MGITKDAIVAKIKAMSIENKEKRKERKNFLNIDKAVKAQIEERDHVDFWVNMVDNFDPMSKKIFAGDLLDTIKKTEKKLDKSRKSAENLPKQRDLTDDEEELMFVTHVLTGASLSVALFILSKHFMLSTSALYAMLAMSIVNMQARSKKPLNGMRKKVRDNKVKKLESKQRIYGAVKEYLEKEEILESGM